MRVVLITPHLPPVKGGISTYSREVIRQLLARDFECHAYGREGESSPEWEIIRNDNCCSFLVQFSPFVKLGRAEQAMRPLNIIGRRWISGDKFLYGFFFFMSTVPFLPVIYADDIFSYLTRNPSTSMAPILIRIATEGEFTLPLFIRFTTEVLMNSFAL